MQVRGATDSITASEARGWAYAPQGGEPVMVQAVLDHEIIGQALANQHRADLAAAGLGDGNSGFTIKFFRPIDPLYLPFIAIKVAGGDAELPRASTLGFGEFFTALHRAYPSAGRSRSVLGGLWTDRTDAAALLRGKLAIGTVPTLVQTAVADLIGAGVVDIMLRAPLPMQSGHADMATCAATLVEDPTVLALLRAVLEDQPLVVAARHMPAETTDLAQPSTRNPSPSPAECVSLLAPSGGSVALEVVRDSHRLAEFTASGASRWTDAAPLSDQAESGGLLDRLLIAAGSVAVIGPGTVHRLRRTPGAAVVEVLCLPARGAPLSLALDAARTEIVRPSGVRLWL